VWRGKRRERAVERERRKGETDEDWVIGRVSV
jgi:hypothetical protein